MSTESEISQPIAWALSLDSGETLIAPGERHDVVSATLQLASMQPKPSPRIQLRFGFVPVRGD